MPEKSGNILCRFVSSLLSLILLLCDFWCPEHVRTHVHPVFSVSREIAKQDMPQSCLTCVGAVLGMCLCLTGTGH